MHGRRIAVNDFKRWLSALSRCSRPGPRSASLRWERRRRTCSSNLSRWGWGHGQAVFWNFVCSSGGPAPGSHAASGAEPCLRWLRATATNLVAELRGLQPCIFRLPILWPHPSLPVCVAARRRQAGVPTSAWGVGEVFFAWVIGESFGRGDCCYSCYFTLITLVIGLALGGLISSTPVVAFTTSVTVLGEPRANPRLRASLQIICKEFYQ